MSILVALLATLASLKAAAARPAPAPVRARR
jgi:hypothetical protein